MSHLNSKQVWYDCTLLSKFSALVVCKTNKHAHKYKHACHKHANSLHNCRLCLRNSASNPYYYECRLCGANYCLAHFIDHAQLFAYAMQNSLAVDCTAHTIEVNTTCAIKKLALFKTIALHLIKSRIAIKVNNRKEIYSQLLRARNILHASNDIPRLSKQSNMQFGIM